MDGFPLKKKLPKSKLPYPRGIQNKAKYFAWKVITPCHNLGRDLLIKANLIQHNYRQKYLIGTIAPDKKIEDLVEHLKNNGYGHHFIAWKDTDAELISLRKLLDFERQYHIRIFSDGEVRGHFEYTPESHPRWHMQDVDREEHKEVFSQLLEGWIVPANTRTVRED